MTALIDVDVQPEPEPLTGEDKRALGDRIRGAKNTPPTTDEIPPAFKDAEKPPKAPSAASLQGRLEAMYATIAITAMPFDAAWANEIMANAPACAEAWTNLARENATVKRMLENLLTVSTTGAVLMAHLPIIITAPGIRDRLANYAIFAAMNGNTPA